MTEAELDKEIASYPDNTVYELYYYSGARVIYHKINRDMSERLEVFSLTPNSYTVRNWLDDIPDLGVMLSEDLTDGAEYVVNHGLGGII